MRVLAVFLAGGVVGFSAALAPRAFEHHDPRAEPAFSQADIVTVLAQLRVLSRQLEDVLVMQSANPEAMTSGATTADVSRVAEPAQTVMDNLAASSGTDQEMKKLLSVLWLCEHDGGNGIQAVLTRRGRSPFEPGVFEAVARATAQLRQANARLPDHDKIRQARADIRELEALLQNLQDRTDVSAETLQALRARLDDARRNDSPMLDELDVDRKQILDDLDRALE